MSTYHGVNARLAKCLNSVLNVKALVGTFNKEKALVGALSVIVKTDGSFAAQLPHTPCAHAQLLCKKLPEKRFPVSRTNNN